MTLTHGSCFTGKGGFDLGAKWAGIPTLWQCEIVPFLQRELRARYPEATLYPDIATLDLQALEKVDIITGGPPCQPFSTAGQRRGAEDHRYLWPAMRAVIEAVRPRYALVENVVGIASMVLPVRLAEVEGETVLLRIIRDLVRLGYEFPQLPDGTPIVCRIPACAVGAPHRRDRFWICASLENADLGTEGWSTASGGQPKHGHAGAADAVRLAANAEGSERQLPRSARDGRDGLANLHSATTHPAGDGRHQEPQVVRRREPIASAHDSHAAHPHSERQLQPSGAEREIGRWAGHSNQWAEPWPTVVRRLCAVDDGLPAKLRRRERGPSNRNQHLKGYGNAIMPQIAYEYFKAIQSTYATA
jgi:DNA (cytosine-5)-methyltransferase 1